MKKRKQEIKEKSIGSSPFITVLLLIIIVVLVGFLGNVLNSAGYITLPKIDIGKASNFEKALKEHNYQAAYTIFSDTGNKEDELQALSEHLNEYFNLCLTEENNSELWTKFRGIEVFNEHISQTVLNKMDEIVSRFYSGEFSEQDAKTYISRIGKFSFAKEKTVLCKEEIEKRDKSKNAYENGVNLYNTGKIEEAVKEFKKVSEKDTERYSLAKEALETCKNSWGEGQLEKAQTLIDAKNFSGAKVFLEDLIELFEEFEKAQTMLDALNNQS